MNLIAKGPDGKILFLSEEEHRNILSKREEVSPLRMYAKPYKKVKSSYDPFRRLNLFDADEMGGALRHHSIISVFCGCDLKEYGEAKEI